MESLAPTDNTIVVDNGHVGMDASTSNNVGNSEATLPIKKKAHKKRKAQKGRFKKLWRRAVGPPPGITCRTEWSELIELHSSWNIQQANNKEERADAQGDCKNSKPGGGGVATDQDAMLGPLPGPSITSTSATQQQCDFGQLEKWQMTEGSDHRDLIINLLFSEGWKGNNCDITPQSKKKKRKLNPANTTVEENGSKSLVSIPPLPSWASISNLPSVGGLAVIELEVVRGDADRCPLMPSQRISDSMNAANKSNIWSSLLSNECNNAKRMIGAACKVNMFQGDRHPKSISDVLMFVPPPPANTKEATRLNNDGSFNLDCALDSLLLNPKQLRKEGFPIEANGSASEERDAKVSIERIREMSTLLSKEKDVQFTTTHDALEFINALSVNVVLGNGANEDENNTDIVDDIQKMEHYVKSFPLLNGDAQTLQQRKVFAIDCEMVKTSSALPELARVSVIMLTEGSAGDDGDNEKSVVVLDELVKPRRQVLDYLTEYSGITAKMLDGVGTRIEDIQVWLLGMIDENDILIGHSLENDLLALRFIHHNIIDTSVVFRGFNGRKFSLKHLCNVLLQRKIQNGCGSYGHCSTEDAEAALILALRRARRGDSFRLKENSKRQNILSIFQTINRATNGENKEDSECFAERNDGSCVCIGDNDWITKYAQTADGAHHVLSCESITSSMSMAVPSWLSSDKSNKRAGFLWAHLQCEDRKGKWISEVKKLDEIVKALVDRVPLHIPILLVCQSNHKKALALTKQRKAAQNPKATSQWSSQQEEEWSQSIKECKSCEAIWMIGGCPSVPEN